MTAREELIALIDRLDEAQLEAYYQDLLERQKQKPEDDAPQGPPTASPPPQR